MLRKILTLLLAGMLVVSFIACEEEDDSSSGGDGVSAIKDRVGDLESAYNTGEVTEVNLLIDESAESGGGGYTQTSLDELKSILGDQISFSSIEATDSGDTGSATATSTKPDGTEASHSFSLVKTDGTWYFLKWEYDGSTAFDKKKMLK